MQQLDKDCRTVFTGAQPSNLLSRRRLYTPEDVPIAAVGGQADAAPLPGVGEPRLNPP